MERISTTTLIFLILSCFGLQSCLAADSIIPGQSLTGKETLVSSDESFAVGFFSPGRSQNRYIGIWYNKISVQRIVWVANRENPVTDSSSGVLQIGFDGNLVVLDVNGSILWSTNSSLPVNSNQTAKLLDSGNLVLTDDNSGRIVWQSFDSPSNTLLPGMKLGINLKTRHSLLLTSWKNPDDPSTGNFSYSMDHRGSPQMFLKKGVDLIWRSGPWNGKGWSGVPEMNDKNIYYFSFVSNRDEIYYTYSLYNNSIVSILVLDSSVLDSSGILKRITWNEGKRRWISSWVAPRDECEVYGACGFFSSCSSGNSTFCNCLPGFKPKSSQDWYLKDWSSGCARRSLQNCGKGDVFLRLMNKELPDTIEAQVDESLSIEDCKTKCMNNCNCTAYANPYVNGTGSGCVIWVGDLMDLRDLSDDGQEFYLRGASSELGDNRQVKDSSIKKRIIVGLSIAATLTGMLLLVCTGFCILKKKKKIKGVIFFSYGKKLKDEDNETSSELQLFDFGTIQSATGNFCDTNKLGQGGYGPVYKGKLSTGQEIAVKRLSKSSEQGKDEFENEVKLIAKLQHRNLVRLLGFCNQGEEKMLVYECMPNRSLDSFLFDQNRRALLDWPKRFNIILGIARGLLYLHEDSRLRIIHRDLKTSNILLDAEMNPKISDFGMARSFGGNETGANTEKVVGTCGYMSPEYAMDGIYSVKSDVFSFGVLVLEIVSGKKSNGFYVLKDALCLIGYGWQLWKEGKGLDLIDPLMGGSCVTNEVLRCIHIGLLCVQESTVYRPNMSSVVSMLSSEITNLVNLPPPEKPAFSMGLAFANANPYFALSKPYSMNNLTITMVEAR